MLQHLLTRGFVHHLYFASLFVTILGQNLTDTPPSTSNLVDEADFIFGICAAIIVLFLSVTIVVLFCHLWSRSKKQAHHISRNEDVALENLAHTKPSAVPNDYDVLPARRAPLNGSATHTPAPTEERVTSYYHRYESTLTGYTHPTGMPIADYPKYVHDNRQSLELIEEFEALPNVNHDLQTYAKLEQNKPKNRYRNILPYNKSRVVLSKLEDDEFSDYINASYIDSFTREKAYIACQGPKKNTLNDFWRMIWEGRIRVIAMVTKLEEGLKTKCEQYWPEPGEEQVYGELEVKSHSTEEKEFGVIRVFRVQKESETSRMVFHYQFTKWPDKSVPKQTSLFLRYLREVKKTYNEDDSGPLVIHCSAGIGRSGVAIAIDSVVEQAKKTDRVNVHGFVQTMRECRQNMVQTDEQYIFLHEAILEALICDDTRIPVEEFSDRLSQLREKQTGGAQNLLAKEFETLSRICPDPAPIAVRTGSRHDCSMKNRDINILPIERNRAMLQTRYSTGPGGDYINASFVKSTEVYSGFIVTQMPLPETVIDFWSLVYDYKPTKIVMMNHLDKTDTTCAQYWPDGGAVQHGPFTISTTSTEKQVGMISRTLQVQLTDSQNVRVVHQYQFLGWPGDNPKLLEQGKKLLIELVQAVYPAASGEDGEEDGDHGQSKVLIHCMNGAGRSGVFCAVKMGLDQVREENAVDVFQITKALRADRMRMVSTQEEYLYCYETIDHYLKHKDDDDKTEDEEEVGEGGEPRTQTNNATTTTTTTTTKSPYENHAYINTAFVGDDTRGETETTHM